MRPVLVEAFEPEMFVTDVKREPALTSRPGLKPGMTFGNDV